MADRYLLESGSPDGYLLEDGTGVLILEVADPAEPGAATTYYVQFVAKLSGEGASV